MAVVRFSDELQTAIIDNAKALFNPRISKLMDSPPDLGDEIATMVTAEHAPLVNTLPMEFFHRLQHVSLTIATDRGNRSFELKTKNEYPVPRNWVTNSDGSKYDSGDDLFATAMGLDEQIIATLKLIIVAHLAIEVNRKLS